MSIVHRPHSCATACSGHTVSREAVAVRGEPLVPFFGESVLCDGSRVLSLGPFVYVADVLHLFLCLILISLLVSNNVNL